VTALSFCVVNTNQREQLLRCLDAVAAEVARVPFATEVLVLDNASEDGSAEAARAHPAVTEVVALDRRRGKAENDSALLQRARGDACLLLNEDAELCPGATEALHAVLNGGERRAVAAARLLAPDGIPQPSAWRFPTPATALLAATLVGARRLVQSTGEAPREVDWAQSSAMLVRRDAAAQVGWLDPAFFVYSDEVDLCRRLRDAGWSVWHVPGARAVHHEGLSRGGVPERRIVEFSRNRDRYLRKHHGPAAALAVRVLTAWTYALRALAALVLPGHDPRRYLRHVTASLAPGRGEGLREAAAAFNAARDAADARAATPARPAAGTP
jgi:N-acetylglucosaminyl-diphospho-decaprenol L-rhamnosyltransferase